jgi:site-specific DNA-methyltransferase (adenine-specific)
MFRKPIEESTVAKQVLKTGTGAMNIEACRVNTADKVTATGQGFKTGKFCGIAGIGDSTLTGQAWELPSGGRWPANLTLQHAGCDERGCVDECPVKVLDGQSGVLISNGVVTSKQTHRDGRHTQNAFGKYRDAYSVPQPTNSGGASRFFSQFHTSQQTLHFGPSIGLREARRYADILSRR